MLIFLVENAAEEKKKTKNIRVKYQSLADTCLSRSGFCSLLFFNKSVTFSRNVNLHVRTATLLRAWFQGKNF